MLDWESSSLLFIYYISFVTTYYRIQHPVVGEYSLRQINIHDVQYIDVHFLRDRPEQFEFGVFSFIQSLLEPGSAGSAGEAQHSDPGLQQLHVSHQVPLHAERHHGVHQQEQDQQPACVCGRNQTEVSKHKVSVGLFCLSAVGLELVHLTIFILPALCFYIPFKYRILSMMNNEAAPSYFNGGSLTQYKDYR